jgi:hypothetical protein
MKLAAVLLLAAASALAESVIDYNKIPGCARQCTVLDQAEKGCVPPAAPSSNQATYQSCFCQSALLSPLRSSGSQCQPACSQEDATKISQYYTGLCNGPVVNPPSQTTGTTTGTATATAGAIGKVVRPGEERGKDWYDSRPLRMASICRTSAIRRFANVLCRWDTHYQYVIMVIVIFIAIVFFWVGGIWLRRRFERKADAKRANLAASDAPYQPSGPDIPPPVVPKTESRPDMAMTALPPAADTGRHRLRSRSSTLSGLGSSKATTPQPIVWGPHQHLAHSQSNNPSPGPSIPPSPTLGISPPTVPFRNREANRSDTRFSSYRGTQTSINEEGNCSSASSVQGRPGATHRDPSASADSIERPLNTIGEPIRDVKRQTITAARSNPSLVPLEPQTAQVCDPSPQKLQKAPKH